MSSGLISWSFCCTVYKYMYVVIETRLEVYKTCVLIVHERYSVLLTQLFRVSTFSKANLDLMLNLFVNDLPVGNGITWLVT